MNLKKRAMYAGMAAALALSLTVPTFAAGDTVGTGNGAGAPLPGGKGGETIISVLETDVDPTNVSFEVPLYLTLAVINEGATAGKTVIKAPTTGYHITNTSKAANGTDAATYDIGVTSMYVASLKNSSWNLVDEATVANYQTTDTTVKGMSLKFTDKNGTLPLPFGVLAADGKWIKIDLTASDNLFYDQGNTKYRGIAVGEANALEIKVVPTVNKYYNITKTTTGTPAVASAAPQFRVTYVVSALDANGMPIGNVYAGGKFGPAPDYAMLPDDANLPVSRYDTNNDPIVGGTGTKP